jgi:hypothetical protein
MVPYYRYPRMFPASAGMAMAAIRMQAIGMADLAPITAANSCVPPVALPAGSVSIGSGLKSHIEW